MSPLPQCPWWVYAHCLSSWGLVQWACLSHIWVWPAWPVTCESRAKPKKAHTSMTRLDLQLQSKSDLCLVHGKVLRTALHCRKFLPHCPGVLLCSPWLSQPRMPIITLWAEGMPEVLVVCCAWVDSRLISILCNNTLMYIFTKIPFLNYKNFRTSYNPWIVCKTTYTNSIVSKQPVSNYHRSINHAESKSFNGQSCH